MCFTLLSHVAAKNFNSSIVQDAAPGVKCRERHHLASTENRLNRAYLGREREGGRAQERLKQRSPPSPPYVASGHICGASGRTANVVGLK